MSALGLGFPLSQVSLVKEHLWRVPTYLLYDTANTASSFWSHICQFTNLRIRFIHHVSWYIIIYSTFKTWHKLNQSVKFTQVSQLFIISLLARLWQGLYYPCLRDCGGGCGGGSWAGLWRALRLFKRSTKPIKPKALIPICNDPLFERLEPWTVTYWHGNK